jgi:uncharacterized protein (DUF2267 family)
MVEFRTYVNDLQQQARVPAPDRAIAALRAFFVTLAERLPSRDALDVATGLPRELASWLLTPPRASGEDFDVPEFLFRMGTRAKLDRDAARFYAMIIGDLLRRHLSKRALTDLLRALPDDLAMILFAEPDEAPKMSF